MLTDLPAYIKNSNQENYNEEFNQTLRQWFNSNGLLLPSLTSTQVTALLALSVPTPAGTMWYNSTLNKLQFVGAGNTTQVITSA
jgi:hypothetical protein